MKLSTKQLRHLIKEVATGDGLTTEMVVPILATLKTAISRFNEEFGAHGDYYNDSMDQKLIDQLDEIGTHLNRLERLIQTAQRIAQRTVKTESIKQRRLIKEAIDDGVPDDRPLNSDEINQARRRGQRRNELGGFHGGDPDTLSAKEVSKYFINALSSLQAGEDFQQEFASYLDHVFDDASFYPVRHEDVDRMASSVARQVATNIARNQEFQDWIAKAVEIAYRRGLK